MAIIISSLGVDWGTAFDGFVPSAQLFKSGGLYTSIGIIGATVMPHSVFLGSALATQDRLASKSNLHPVSTADSSFSSDTGFSLPSTEKPSTAPPKLNAFFSHVRSKGRNVFKLTSSRKRGPEPTSHAERENNSYEFVRSHIYHGTVDILISLFGLAVVINSLILILASAVFFYGKGSGSGGPASLFDAYDLLKDVIGKPTMFALALLAAGQSASIVATMAGQTVSEGFLRWRTSPVVRRLITRSLGLVPSMVVAIAVGRSGVNTLLVASQVVLSIVLPFIIFPLMLLTSSKEVMRVRKPLPSPTIPSTLPLPPPLASESIQVEVDEAPPTPQTPPTPPLLSDPENPQEYIDYSNGIVITVIGYAIWFVVLAANVYAIVSLGLGQTG